MNQDATNRAAVHGADAQAVRTGLATPEAILDDWYAHHYSQVAATADGSFFERYMHRAMEGRHGADRHFGQVLEVGGNRGEHLPYVRHGYDRYLLTDLRPPTVGDEVRADPRIELGECDVTGMPFDSGRFDRVISTCVLHHVDSPFGAAAEMRRVVRPDGGVVTVLVPTDPGLVYRTAKALTSGRAARRRGIAELHGLVGALDHRNHVRSVLTQLRYVFRADEVAVDWYPFRVPSVELNAFVVVNARVRGDA
jgi:phosphatidylethanolamine/phosphatidyl-N-methylethanolamine N-methyltransferase